MNVADARGLTFECQPGCGFCCTATPLVLAQEAGALGALVTRAADGTLRIPLRAHACSALREDRACGVYEARPNVCRLYPYQVHAGRRIQATVTFACPGIFEAGPGEPAETGAQRAVALALAQPGAQESAARAKGTYTELDRRMKEWGVMASPDRLRAAFLPHADALAQPGALPAVFASLEPGDLVIEGDAARSVAPLFEGDAGDSDVSELFAQGADEAFDEPQTVIWVEPDFAWTRAASSGGVVKLMRTGRPDWDADARELPTDLTLPATRLVSRYLARLMHRDQTEGAALWLVDASGYQATPAAAFARVLAEASLQVALRAALFAAEEGLDEVGPAHARRGIAAYETAYHSLPTMGSVL